MPGHGHRDPGCGCGGSTSISTRATASPLTPSLPPTRPRTSASRLWRTSCATPWAPWPGRPAPEYARRPGIGVREGARHHQSTARDMTRLIDDLMDGARITQGKLDVRLAPTDLTAVLHRSLEDVDRQLVQREQQVSSSLSLETWYVLGDTTRLEQAFGNLVSNASKFTRQGGQIWLSAEKGVAARRGEIVVRIRDEGIGIAPDMLPHVFDLFTGGPLTAPGAGPRGRTGARAQHHRSPRRSGGYPQRRLTRKRARRVAPVDAYSPTLAYCRGESACLYSCLSSQRTRATTAYALFALRHCLVLCLTRNRPNPDAARFWHLAAADRRAWMK